MSSKGLLRFLIVTEIVFIVVGATVSIYTESLLPDELRAYQQAMEQGEWSPHDTRVLLLGGPVAVLLFGSLVGLFFFWSPARFVLFGATILGLAITPFLGPQVDSGWGRPFSDAAMILNGAILALVYFSPPKEFHDKEATALAAKDFQRQMVEVTKVVPSRSGRASIPSYVHAICAWPLVMVVFGGAVGGALGGLAYGINIMIYKKGAPVWAVVFSSMVLGAAVVILWSVIAELIRGVW
jgi:hypothetical protein